MWVKTIRKTYKVYLAKNNDIVAEGTAEECAEQMDILVGSFRSMVHHAQTGARKKYRVEVFGADLIPELVKPKPKKPKVEKPVKISEEARVARNWDKFCEPIRRKYGIKVKHYDA